MKPLPQLPPEIPILMDSEDELTDDDIRNLGDMIYKHLTDYRVALDRAFGGKYRQHIERKNRLNG